MSPHSIITGTILDSIRICQSAIEPSSRLARYKCATKHFVSQSIQFVAGFLRTLENHLSTNTKMEACVGRPTGGHSFEFFLEINSAGHRLAPLVLWHVMFRPGGWFVRPDIFMGKIEIVSLYPFDSLWHCIILLWITTFQECFHPNLQPKLPANCDSGCSSSTRTQTSQKNMMLTSATEAISDIKFQCFSCLPLQRRRAWSTLTTCFGEKQWFDTNSLSTCYRLG